MNLKNTLIKLGQVKRCGEMARKLRFLKDQMVKAGISVPSRSVVRKDVDLDELEVCAVCL